MSQFCTNCGSPLPSDVRFCQSCGVKTNIPLPPEADNYARAEEKFKKTMPKSSINNRNNSLPADSENSPDTPGFIGFFKSGVRAVMTSFIQLLKNPKRLIPLLGLGLLWLVLSILSALEINPWPVWLLSFLTFAQGGMYSGLIGAVGGIVGKTVITYFFTKLIYAIFSGKNPFQGMGKGFSSLISGLTVKNISSAAQLILGIGFALVVFNFLTGNASPVNGMAGIVGFFLAILSLGSNAGFIRGFLSILLSVLSKGRPPSQVVIGHLISGYAVGSVAGIALTALPIPFTAYVLGLLLLIVGLILAVIGNSQKEVTAL